jgi:integrase
MTDLCLEPALPFLSAEDMFPNKPMDGRSRRDVSLSEAITLLLNAKRLCNCRKRYIDSLSAYLLQFARGRESARLDSIDVVRIEEWFSSRNEALSTMASNIGRLSALFGFAERRGWIDKNPCKMMEKIRIDRKAPRILSPVQARVVMTNIQKLKPHEMGFFSLALFAGVRPEELERITWDSINLKDGIVTIDAAASKVRRRRIMELEPNALAWLKLAHECDARLPVGRMTRRRYLDYAERWLGFDTWPQDCLRHTAASYLLARHKNAPLVANRLGNSPSILLRHYQELVTAEDCATFWSISPSP